MFAQHNPSLYAAMTRFIGDHCAVESTSVIEAAIKSIAEAKSLDDAVAVPVSSGAFDFGDSLKWLFFVHTSASISGKTTPTDAIYHPTLDLHAAFGVVASTFDLATEAVVWGYYDEDSE